MENRRENRARRRAFQGPDNPRTRTDDFNRIRHVDNVRKRRANSFRVNGRFNLSNQFASICSSGEGGMASSVANRFPPALAGKIGNLGDLELRIAYGGEFAQVAH